MGDFGLGVGKTMRNHVYTYVSDMLIRSNYITAHHVHTLPPCVFNFSELVPWKSTLISQVRYHIGECLFFSLCSLRWLYNFTGTGIMDKHGMPVTKIVVFHYVVMDLTAHSLSFNQVDLQGWPSYFCTLSFVLSTVHKFLIFMPHLLTMYLQILTPTEVLFILFGVP